MTALTRRRRGYAVEACEGAGKALRRVVAVLERRVDNEAVLEKKLLTGERQPPHTDVIAEAVPEQNAEHALKMKA